MSNDPDFLITCSGQNITPSVMNWVLTHSDNDTSSLIVDIENQNSQWAGCFQPNDQATIVFGYSGNMAPQVTMDLLFIQPYYGDGIKRIQLQAFDVTHKLHGDCLKGCHKRGTNHKDAISNTVQANTGVTPNVSLTPPNMQKDYRIPIPGLSSAQSILWMAAQCESGQNPDASKSIFTYTASPPSSFAGPNQVGYASYPIQNKARLDNRKPDDTSKNPNQIDDNRAANSQKKRAGITITANLVMLGYPGIKAEDICTIQGADEWSGDWYANCVRYTWDGVFLTHVALMRGQVGSGPCNASNAIVMNCNIFDGSIYVGPRKTNGSSVTTFTYGDGSSIQSFQPCLDARQKQGGANVSAKGKLADASGKQQKVSYSNSKSGN